MVAHSYVVTPWLCVVYKVTINQVVVPKADGSTHGYVVTPWLCVVYKVTINQVVVPVNHTKNRIINVMKMSALLIQAFYYSCHLNKLSY